MKEYTLINPTILGTFPTTFKAENPIAAGKQFWEELTVNGKYVTNHLPIYCFSLQEAGGNLHHMVVREKTTKTGTHTEYEIEEDMNNKVDSDKMKQLLRESSMIKQKAENKMEGGKRKRYKEDDSSDGSDSDFDYLKLHKVWRPITYWWYVPTIYHVQKVFTPTFNCPVAPYVELRLL